MRKQSNNNTVEVYDVYLTQEFFSQSSAKGAESVKSEQPKPNEKPKSPTVFVNQGIAIGNVTFAQKSARTPVSIRIPASYFQPKPKLVDDSSEKTKLLKSDDVCCCRII